MNSEEGKLYFGAGLDNSKLQKDAQEATSILSDIGSQAEKQSRNIKTLLSDVPSVNIDVVTNASTALDTINAAFAEIDRVVETNKGAIKELDAEYSRLSEEMGEAFKGGNDAEYRRLKEESDAIRENIALRKQINREAANTADELKKLEDAMQKEASAVENSTKQHSTLKQEIRELEKAMAEYRAKNGTDQTAEYQAMAKRLGELRDIRGDIQRQGSIFSNDQAQFAGVMSGLQGVTGAFTAAQGAISLFAGKNEDLQRIMLKVQSLMAITMGLQQLSNALNKDSAFRLVTLNSLKEWWAKITAEATGVQVAETAATTAQVAADVAETEAETANTAATELNTAAKAKNTAAAGANAASKTLQTGASTAATGAIVRETVATGAATTATWSLTGALKALWAFVRSIPLWGWLLAGVALITKGVMDAKDKADEMAEKIKKSREEAEEFNRGIAKSAGEVVAAYERMRREYIRLRTEQEKTKWIKENQSGFRQLGITVNSVTDAETAFIKNTDKMIKAFQLRAEAAAWQTKVAEEYTNLINRRLELESKSTPIVAGSKVPGSSHTKEGGKEYVDQETGQWVYTEKGAKEAEEERQKSIKNDAKIAQIQARIDQYSEKVLSLSREVTELLGSNAGTEGGKNPTKDNTQKLADEAAKRVEMINAYGEKVSLQVRETALAIRQAEIDGEQEGFKKEQDQIRLNYDRLILENDKRRKEMLDALKDKKVLEWKNGNPKATQEQEIEYKAKLNVDVTDLTEEQQKQLEAYSALAEQYLNNANKNLLEKMLEDVLTYEQQRTAIVEDYAKKRKAMYETDSEGNYKLNSNGDKIFRQGASQGNVEELNRQEEEALNAVDEQFASRGAAFEAWCEEVANLTLKQLQSVLEKAEAELKALEKAGNASDVALAQARAKVTKLKKEVEKQNAKTDLSPGKRSLEDWSNLYRSLQDCNKEFQSIGDTVGGVAGDVIKTVGTVMASTLSAVNGIVQVVNMSATAMTGTATAAATAIQTIEKASVILTVISAALSVAMAIVNLFNNDGAKQEEIEELQGRIDQLQWELDNAEALRIQEKYGSSVARVREIYLEVLQTVIAIHREELANANVFMKRALWQKVQTEAYAKSIAKVADYYAQMAYTADKALGEDRFKSARQQLENIAEQQLLIQQQIDLENSKKHDDQDKIAEWKQKIEELGEEAVSVINDIVEEIIGGSSSEIANELADAFFDAFEAGEDAAEAWGEKVNEIVGEVMKRMLVQQVLETRLGNVFNKYREKWFNNGVFQGIETVMESMNGFASDLNEVRETFAAVWDNLPEDVKAMFNLTGDAMREATQKGIAQASQESVDELNGRATAIQSHTYSIAENTKVLLQTTNQILQSVLNIEGNTDGVSGRMEVMEGDLKEIKDTVSDIALKGIKIK